MAKSAKNNSVFGDVAVSLISEGKREKKKESIELLEEKETISKSSVINAISSLGWPDLRMLLESSSS